MIKRAVKSSKKRRLFTNNLDKLSAFLMNLEDFWLILVYRWKIRLVKERTSCRNIDCLFINWILTFKNFLAIEDLVC